MSIHKEEILRLYKEGKSYNQIKSELGCSKGTISYHLGIGQKEKTKERRTKHRNNVRKYIQEYKQGKTCTDCKEDYPYWMLEFDHLGDKEFTIGNFTTSTTNLEKIINEISKCEIVCANCHKNRTYIRSITSGSATYDIDEFYE